ncbi:hypothetical protein SAMN05421855_102704 [Ulvibacter litoralis]|uniref:Uncharacterized protein n=1 Tax=Ulvibacter litoralis TaxID=227084 RepID=A0A1G7FQJ2_9FLAO|nr:hypothetical protein SAMN05421855_102704 [Ulvibacter litoralis]
MNNKIILSFTLLIVFPLQAIESIVNMTFEEVAVPVGRD